MLSKPKYMLPGNLSQGAPILEPDEENKYKFSFALDGDEIIEKYRYKIYSLEPLELAKEDIKLSFNDFYIKEEKTNDSGEIVVENIPLTNYIELTHIEVALDDERNINFLAKFSFPKNINIYVNEEKYSQDNFLLSNYVGTIPFNFNITISKWGVLSYLNRKAKSDELNTVYDWRTPLLNIFKDNGETNEFSKLNFNGMGKLKFVKDIEEKTAFISENFEIIGTFSYTYNDFYKIQQKGEPYIAYNNKQRRPWCEDKTYYEIKTDENNSFRRERNLTEYFNKIMTLDETYVYYYSAFYGGEIYPQVEEYPKDILTYTKEGDSIWNKNSYYNHPAAFFFEFAPYGDADYYNIGATTLEINLKTSEQNLFLEEEKSFNDMPKNQKGQYNFITFELPKTLIPPGHYCWGVEILKKDSFNDYEIIATSNYYHFDILESKKEYGLSISTAPKTSIVINGVIDNNPYLLDYSFEISNDKILFYKSPWINSNNSTIIFPFKYFPFKTDYFITFTTTDLEQKMLSANNFFYSLKSEKYNKTIEFKEESEKISLKSEPNIQINIDDIGNNFSEYYYYLINDDTGEWQYSLDEVDEETGEINPVYHLNKNLDKWRLILTKGEKNDIIEEKRMCHYQVDKIYDFYYNLVSGSIGNNAETTVNTNFTRMPSVQKGFSNYWSGSLSALMGICDERGEFAQTIEQEKALEQLVLDQEHDKFLLDREGNIWQVETSAPLTIVNQDGLVQVDKLIDLKTITINWVQVGSPTQIVFDFEE